MKDQYVILTKYKNGNIKTDGFYFKDLAERVAQSMVHGDVIGTLVCKIEATHMAPGQFWNFVQTEEYARA